MRLSVSRATISSFMTCPTCHSRLREVRQVELAVFRCSDGNCGREFDRAALLEAECRRMHVPPEAIRMHTALADGLWYSMLSEDVAQRYSTLFQPLTNDQLARLMTADAAPLTVHLSRLAERLLRQAALSKAEIQQLTRSFSLILAQSLAIEFGRRECLAEQKHSKAGLRLREFVMMKREWSIEEARALAQLGHFKKRWNPDAFGSARDAEDESIQMYWEALAEGLQKVGAPSIASQEGLLELLSGCFGRIAATADNVLRERLRTLKRRQEMTDLGAKEAFPVRFVSPRPDNKILLGEIASTLTQRERQVAVLSHWGFAEEEIAQKLGVSQPRISQICRQVKKKVSAALLPLPSSSQK